MAPPAHADPWGSSPEHAPSTHVPRQQSESLLQPLLPDVVQHTPAALQPSFFPQS